MCVGASLKFFNMLQNLTAWFLLFWLLGFPNLTEEKITFIVFTQKLLTQTGQIVAHFGKALVTVTVELLNKLGLAAESEDQRRKDADDSLPLERCELWSFNKLELFGEIQQSSQNCECDNNHHIQRNTSDHRRGLAGIPLRASAQHGHDVARVKRFLI